MAFTDTYHCKSGRHCRVCRSQEAGRAWRASIAMHYGGEIDFACPSGLPWFSAETAGQFLQHKNMTGPVQKTLAARRLEEHCGHCEDFFEGGICVLFRGGRCTRCEFRAYLNRPGAICPASGKGFQTGS